MTSEEYQWDIKKVKERYETYDLTFEQAEQVYRYEEERHGTYSGKYIFSTWEEWDYEFSVFREILNADQLRRYEEQHLESVRNFEKQLLEQDAQREHDVSFAEERLDYYENVLLPEFQKGEFWRFVVLPSERTKIDYLKQEYKHFLSVKKRGILVEHFREYRLFGPNLLKSSLLRHEVDYLWPNYPDFQKQMDEPTQAVDSYLRSKLDGYLHTTELLDKIMEDVKAFSQTNFKKHHGDPGGWHVKPWVKNPEETKKDILMASLLRDREKYGLRDDSITTGN